MERICGARPYTRARVHAEGSCTTVHSFKLTLSKIKNLYLRILKEGRLHSNTVKETFPLQKEWAKKERAEEKLGKKTKKWGGGVEKSQRSIMNVQTGSIGCLWAVIIQQASIMELQRGGRVHLLLTPPLSCSHLCKEGSLPDYAPCGCNDKDVCAAVRECAHTFITHPSPSTAPHSAHTATHLLPTQTPWQQPATKARCIQKSSRHVSPWLHLPLFHSTTRSRTGADCLEGRHELGWFSSPLSIWLTHPSGAISSVC